MKWKLYFSILSSVMQFYSSSFFFWKQIYFSFLFPKWKAEKFCSQFFSAYNNFLFLFFNHIRNFPHTESLCVHNKCFLLWKTKIPQHIDFWQYFLLSWVFPAQFSVWYGVWNVPLICKNPIRPDKTAFKIFQEN